MARASSEIGPDAVVLSVRKVTDYRGKPEFELLAADPQTAEEEHRQAILPSGHPLASIGMAPSTPPDRPLVIAFVGPTGSGKTTTIAKVANHPEIFGPRIVGFICLDTYRVGAMEQLKIFAALSKVAVATVFESKDIPRALRKLRDCEVILIDTPGRGPAFSSDAEAAHALLRLLHPDEVHLTLPAGLRTPVARAIFAGHRPCGLTHLIATKLDECPEDASAYTLASEFELPMRWVTDGQAIPEGIRSAGLTARREVEPEPRFASPQYAPQAERQPAPRFAEQFAHQITQQSREYPEPQFIPPPASQRAPASPRVPQSAQQPTPQPARTAIRPAARTMPPPPARAWTWDDMIRQNTGTGRR
jgi:flagellar biosynthesis protein FlhF